MTDRATPEKGRPGFDFRGRPIATPEQDAGHGRNCDGCLMLAMVQRAERAEATVAEVREWISKANALRPEDFQGDKHLAPAFRSTDFRAAFTALAEIVNGIEASVQATPLPPGSDGGVS